MPAPRAAATAPRCQRYRSPGDQSSRRGADNGRNHQHARPVVQRAHTDITQGVLVDTYARSLFSDTRCKAAKFGAMGSTLRATKPTLSG